MNLNFKSPGQIILIASVVLGNLEWLLTIIYAGSTNWNSSYARAACIFFIIAQPLFYLMIYSLYFLQHRQCQDRLERYKLLKYGPIYALLQQAKLLNAFDPIYEQFNQKIGESKNYIFLSKENCFRIQIFIEFAFGSFPQLIVQSLNNNRQ